MTATVARPQQGALLAQLCWLIRLRWVAGVAVIVGSYVDGRWLHTYPFWERGVAVGVAILVYNAVLWRMLRGAEGSCGGTMRGRTAQDMGTLSSPLLLAWVQLLLDMGCLTLLTVWTGGAGSPLRGFFVFHMVFASILLPRTMAYGGALAAMVMLGVGLWLAGQWPVNQQQWLLLLGWAVMLVMTVYLANHITRSLRRQRRRLIRQNRHIRRITRQLRRHQKALIQHEKMVAMGQMAAGITHEIANPLASMDSVLQLVLRKPERLRPDVVQTLREQVARIDQIIQQMKAFAHPTEMQKQTLLINEVVEQALEMVGFDRRIRQVRIERQLSPDAGEVELMPQALQQVLVNLIINALDAMDDTPDGRLTIRTERRESACLIEVTDTGHGIRPEHMGRIFEPFFTTKPVGKGTGLGLSISYSLVQRQGGSIAVKSQPLKGTTFTIKLPVGDSRQRERSGGAVAVGEKKGTIAS